MKPNKKIDPKEFYNSIRMTLNKKDLMTFVSGLHEVQEEMIEELVRRKEVQGFPEANTVIKHIQSLK
jgi:spermidine synthase